MTLTRCSWRLRSRFVPPGSGARKRVTEYLENHNKTHPQAPTHTAPHRATPSKTKLKTHTQKIGKLIDEHKSVPQSDLIAHLNPVIRGWTAYYSGVVSKRIFNLADTTLFSQLKAWAEHRHPNKSSWWSCQKYWQTVGSDTWVFKPYHRKIRLLKASSTVKLVL